MSIERSLQLYKGLVEVSALLVAITDFTELLSAILAVARRVMDAEASSLFLVEPDGSLKLTLASTSGEEPPPVVIVPRGRGIAGWVLEHRKSVLIEDAYSDPRFYQEADRQSGFTTHSMLCAPLIHDGTEIGVLQVLNPTGKPVFELIDQEAFEAFVNLAATALEKVRSLENQREQARVEQELSLAHEIQASFLPQSLPSRPGLVFAASYAPARNIGGDFYDVVETGPDELFFVIGDVSGKGIPAALVMAQALSLLRLIIHTGISPAMALQRWNQLICGHTIRGMFITATLGRITPSTSQVEIATAGHCNPIIVRTSGPGQLVLEGSPPLGIIPECTPKDHCFKPARGDWLVLYTDGLTESMNPEDEMLDISRVLAVFKTPLHSASDVIFALKQCETAHRSGAEPSDDLTLLVFGFR